MSDTPQSVFVNHLTTLARFLCERPGPQFVPQCDWSDFFDDEKHDNELRLVSQGHVVDRCLHGLAILHSNAATFKSKGGEHPFIISPTLATNGWSRAAIVALQCATVADWPKDADERLTAEHIPRLQNEFKAIAAICPPHTPMAWHLTCVLDILELLQTPLHAESAHNVLVKVAGMTTAAELAKATEQAKRCAFSAKALEYFLALELGEARYEIAQAIDPDKPSIYARQAAASSVFLGATQMADADKKAMKELIIEIPRTMFRTIENERFACAETRTNCFDPAALTALVSKALEFRSRNTWA